MPQFFLAISFIILFGTLFRIGKFHPLISLILVVGSLGGMVVSLINIEQIRKDQEQADRKTYKAAFDKVKFAISNISDTDVICSERQFGYVEEQHGKHRSTHVTGSIKFSQCSTGLEYVLVNYTFTPSCFDDCAQSCDRHGCGEEKTTSAKQCVDSCYKTLNLDSSQESYIRYSKI